MIKRPAMSYNLVLDLDEVLLHDPLEGAVQKRSFFLERSFLPKDSYGNTYLAPAYLTEFLKFSIARFNLAFFSSGDDQRNKSVIQDMWINIFGDDKPERIPIFSREHLTHGFSSDDLNPEVKGKWWSGNCKKDITKVGGLHNTILVDDCKSYVLKGQVPNFLKAPSSGFYAFESLAKDFKEEGSCSRLIEDYFIRKSSYLDDLIAFYKLVYIAGILDTAAQHETGMVNGLYAIQFDEDKPRFDECMRDMTYYQRGYKVLSNFSKGSLPQYFPYIESSFSLSAYSSD